MEPTIETRRQRLQAELAAGRHMLVDLDRQRRELTETMLRIEGALALLDELAPAPAAVTELPRAADDSGA